MNLLSQIFLQGPRSRFRRMLGVLVFMFVWEACPSLMAQVIVSDSPKQVLKRPKSNIHRAEGVQFSPDGEILVVANALEPSIDFFARDEGKEGHFSLTPFARIVGDDGVLTFPHDIAISPDGKYLAVANRRRGNRQITESQRGHDRILIYAIGQGKRYVKPMPIQIICPEEGDLDGVTAVHYSPCGKILAVANLRLGGINLYRCRGDGQIEEKPYQILRPGDKEIVQIDGVAFSQDGKQIGATGNDVQKVFLFDIEEEEQSIFCVEPSCVISSKHSKFNFPHSLAFHPDGRHLAVTSSMAGGITLHIFENENGDREGITSPGVRLEREIYDIQNFSEEGHTPKGEGGLKGIAFSPDGRELAICCGNLRDDRDSSVQLYSVWDDGT